VRGDLQALILVCAEFLLIYSLFLRTIVDRKGHSRTRHTCKVLGSSPRPSQRYICQIPSTASGLHSNGSNSFNDSVSFKKVSMQEGLKDTYFRSRFTIQNGRFSIQGLCTTKDSLLSDESIAFEQRSYKSELVNLQKVNALIQCGARRFYTHTNKRFFLDWLFVRLDLYIVFIASIGDC
jgi:hypothetical protein